MKVKDAIEEDRPYTPPWSWTRAAGWDRVGSPEVTWGECLGIGGWGKLGGWMAPIAAGGPAHARRLQDHRL